MTRVALYARYSSDRQREASIEDQLRICRAQAEREGWEIADSYSDRAISGASLLRPAIQALMEDARAGRFDLVLAESLDRLSRDQEDIAGVYKRLAFAGIRIATVSEGAITELHIGLKGTMGALYLKDLADKTRRGLRGRIEAGRSGGGLCYGYDVVEAGEKRGARQINPAEAAIVRRIFAAYAAGDSARTIAGRLNAEGIPGPRAATWSFSTISGNWKRGTGLLNNELYIGRLVWNRQHFVKDPETGKRQARPNPPEEWVIEAVPDLRIVEPELWDRVKTRQGALRHVMAGTDDRRRPEAARRPKYLFSGLLSCGCCGAGYTLMNRVKYGCSAARNKGTCTNRALIHRDEIEARVLDGLRDRLLHPDLIAEFLAEYQREWNRLRQGETEARAAAEREIADVSRRIEQVVTAIADGMYHPSMKEKMTALETRKADLSDTLARMGAEEAPLRLHPGLAELYRRKIARLAEALNTQGTRTEATEILRGLVSEIRLLPRADGAHDIALSGDLAAILALGEGETTQPRLGAGAASETMVAGVGFEPTTFRL